LSSKESMRFLRSRESSSRSKSKRVLGETPSPLAIATIVSKLGTFFERSTSPQKFPVIFPRSAAISKVIFAALRSLLTRRANSSRCFTPQTHQIAALIAGKKRSTKA